MNNDGQSSWYASDSVLRRNNRVRKMLLRLQRLYLLHRDKLNPRARSALFVFVCVCVSSNMSGVPNKVSGDRYLMCLWFEEIETSAVFSFSAKRRHRWSSSVSILFHCINCPIFKSVSRKVVKVLKLISSYYLNCEDTQN